MTRMIKIIFFSLVLLSNTYTLSFAASETKTSDEIFTVNDIKMEDSALQSEDLEFKKISARLTEIEDNLKVDIFTRQSLEDNTNFLNETELKLDSVVRRLEKDQAYAQNALSAFGEEETSDDSEEAQSIAEMREKYTLAATNYKNKLLEANVLRAEIIRIKALISDAQSRMFGNLVAKRNALIVPKTFWHAISDAAIFFFNVALSPIEWYQNLNKSERSDLHKKGWYVLLILILGLTLGLYLRSYIIKRWGYGRMIDQPGYGQKVIVALVTALAYGVIPSLLVSGCFIWGYTNESLVNSRFGHIIASALFCAFFIIITRATARVILAPWNGRWRLFNITDARAERVFKASTLSLILFGIGVFFIHISKDFDATEPLKLLFVVGIVAIKAFIIILLTVSVFGELKVRDDKSLSDTDDNEDSEQISTHIRIIICSVLFALITFTISVFGYQQLSDYIFNRFFASILACGTFVVIRKILYDVLQRSIIFWTRSYRIRKRLLSKVDFLMTLLINPILFTILIYALLRFWGVSASFMSYGIKKFIFGFKVGGINISLIAILTGIIVFIVSLTLVRLFRNRLSANILTRINIDEGIKHSLLSGVSFMGFCISAILAIAAMGVDLSNLAVIAGALSVGIGFGLQDVIKNLVSGIIILFERPFKVGDWVILGGEEGKIKQINIRSTELETWTRRSVIIPNATLISSSLINLTHGDTWQRQSINVGVSYDSDVELVTRTLIECAKSNKRIAKVPNPVVVFKDFGASSLDFELRFYVSDVRSDFMVSSEVRYAILKRFREEGIEIAYPQIVVHQAEAEAIEQEPAKA